MMSNGQGRGYRHPVSRREFLRGTGVAVASTLAAPALVGCAGAPGPAWTKGDPFSLGVAAGNPVADGFVLWTRLAPEPLSPDPLTPGGMSGGDLAVAYEIASDPGMRAVVRHDTAMAEAAYAYSVHVDVTGLAPDRPYWYRFTSGDAQSRIGRTMTAPAAGAALARLRFGCVSCANYEHGYFSAYRHLADEQPDLVLFLGDYIYEYVETRRPTVRRHSDGVEAGTLPTYRNRYAQYKLDPDLQRLHASAPALITWDDHEVENDYADRWSPTVNDPAKFLVRRAAAYQAFYEHMPLRPGLSHPNGPALRLYDRFDFGDLAEIALLDGRQYRSRVACYAPPKRGGGHIETDAGCPERRDPARSLLGAAQEAWLFDGLARSKARWNLIAQDVLMAELRERQDDGTIGFWTDDWNGYPASRDRLLRHIHDSRVRNPVVFSGDIHSFWTNDLKLDFADPASPTVATEFVGSSVTSYPPPYELFRKFLPDNPHVRYFESRKRGYMSIDLTPAQMTTRFRAIEDAHNPKTTVATLKTFAVEDGSPEPHVG